MTAHPMTTFYTALTRLWTEAKPASAKTTNMQRPAVLFQASTRINAMLGIIGTPPMCPANILGEDGLYEIDAIDATETTVNQSQIESLVIALREYAELIRERVAPEASEAEWMALFQDSLRRGTSAALFAGERTHAETPDVLFQRDMRALLAPLTTL